MPNNPRVIIFMVLMKSNGDFMNSEKIGIYIKKLREGKKWSQQELAQKLYVSQQSISYWEKGKYIPDIEKMQLLSKLFDVPIANILAGEELINETQKNEIIYKVIKEKQKRIKKICFIFITVIITLLLSFLIYYFINSYKSLKVYLIGCNDEQIQTEGVLITSKNKAYFSLNVGNISIKEMYLMYDNEIIYTTEDNEINFQDYYGYNEYINFDLLNDYVNNLYLKVIDMDENEYLIKLILEKDFENDNLIFSQEERIIEEKEKNNLSNIPSKIVEGFIYDEEGNNYYFNTTNDSININILYWIDTRELWVEESYKDHIITWKYYLIDNSIYYEYRDYSDEIVKSFYDNINNIEESNNNDLLITFLNNYITKYIAD